MKCVIVSASPRNCAQFASGHKLIDVRKTKPKLETPFKCYIYCTNDKKLNFWCGKKYSYADEQSHNLFDRCGNGKVIGEFICDRIIVADPGNYVALSTAETMIDPLDLMDYADNKTVYGWHISNLKIYDKPKELSEFKKFCDGVTGCRGCEYYYEENDESQGHFEMCGCDNSRPLKRPPQSWCYAEI